MNGVELENFNKIQEEGTTSTNGDTRQDSVSIDILRRRAMELQELQVQAYSSIEKNGGRTEVKVEAGDAAVKALEAEAVRVVSSMPAWNPGMQGGKPVYTQYVLPIVFRLN